MRVIIRKIYPRKRVEHLRDGWESSSILGRIAAMIRRLIYFGTFKNLERSLDFTFEDFKGEKKLDMSCIPGKIIGH